MGRDWKSGKGLGLTTDDGALEVLEVRLQVQPSLWAKAGDACDVVAGLESTVFVEALTLNKTVLIYNTTGKTISRVYADRGAAIYVTSRTQLIPALLSCLDDKVVSKLNENARQFLHDHGFSGLNASETCKLLMGTR